MRSWLFTHSVRCVGCGELASCTQQESLPDYGWSLHYEDFGYYAGFTDNIDAIMEQRESARVVLCHDCVVKVLEVLPGLAAKIRPGQHPFDGDVPCCRWGWKAD